MMWLFLNTSSSVPVTCIIESKINLIGLIDQYIAMRSRLLEPAALRVPFLVFCSHTFPSQLAKPEVRPRIDVIVAFASVAYLIDLLALPKRNTRRSYKSLASTYASRDTLVA